MASAPNLLSTKSWDLQPVLVSECGSEVPVFAPREWSHPLLQDLVGHAFCCRVLGTMGGYAMRLRTAPYTIS